MKSWLYYVVGAILKLLLSLLVRWQVKGKENVPKEGALLVVANHLHLADPPLIGLALSRKAIFVAKSELFRDRLTSYFVTNFGAFPVRRGRLDRQALRQAERVLAQGLPLIIFPEAKRSQTAQLQPALPGSVVIALRNNVPILPMGISGSEKIKGLAWLVHRPKITVNIGSPFRLPAVDGKLTKEELAKLTSMMMERIAELLPVAYRGNYGKGGSKE